ncbi:hypothetical protein KBH77_04715 [Patescibacteria group bacterium]|nr:hypothetical protein [Patescibacteria group bacterium]
MSYNFDERSTFGDLFKYIASEMKFSERNMSVKSLRNNVKKQILNAKPGDITKDGDIIWDFNLEDCKIKESLESIGLNYGTTEIEVLCIRITETGDGGSGLICDVVTYIIENWKDILEVASNIVTIGMAIDYFINLERNEPYINKERIVQTIRKQEQWKAGFCSTKNFEGKEVVEESIMTYMNYTKDEETKEWVKKQTNEDTNRG